MAQDSTAIPTSGAPRTSLATYIRHNIRDYALLLALIVIMVFFQVTTNGILFRPVNITNLVLQNSYVVIMALGMAAPDFDVVTELWFADRAADEAMLAAHARPEVGGAIAADEENFLDRSKTRFFVVEERR